MVYKRDSNLMDKLVQKPLISVIVPIFQVEKYLDKCVSSLLDQTYRNLEIILVDDGSEDNCPAMCDKYQSEDSRIKVIHQENGGLSRARNAGMKIATGDFIGFVDSDDWIEPNMYEVLMSALLETEADIAICNFQIEAPESRKIPQKTSSFEKRQYSGEETLKIILNGESFIHTFVWNKLYKRTVLANISFPEGKIYEDYLLTAKAVGNAKSTTSIDYVLYHYWYRPESLCHDNENLVKRITDKLDMFTKRIEYVRIHYPALKKNAVTSLHNFCYHEYVSISLYCPDNDKDGRLRRELHRQFCQTAPFAIHNKRRITMTLGQMLFRTWPWLYWKTYTLRRMLHSISTKS